MVALSKRFKRRRHPHFRSYAMHYLYGSKASDPRRLVATFSSLEQLLTYVRWATLEELGVRRGKYEQGSALAGYSGWEDSVEPLTEEDPREVVHNPSPSML
jgi:hypothetical protein